MDLLKKIDMFVGYNVSELVDAEKAEEVNEMDYEEEEEEEEDEQLQNKKKDVEDGET